MELDLDDLMQFRDVDYGDDNDGNRRENDRHLANDERWARNPHGTITNEIGNKIGKGDGFLFDPTLDWYLRIDLDDGVSRKRQKENEREKQLSDTIQKIKLARNIIDIPTLEDGLENVRRSPVKVRQFPPRHSIHWLPVTTPTEQTRLYLTMKSVDAWSLPDKRKFGNGGHGGLLGQDFQEMLSAAEKINEAKLDSQRQEEESLTISQQQPQFTSTLYFSEPMDSEPTTSNHVENSNRESAATILWVDKYKARSYVDLLSDDSVNRTLLTWLKLWDECVFSRKSTNTQPAADITCYTGPAVFKELSAKKTGSENKFNKKPLPSYSNADQLPRTLDNHKRPIHKIVLLTGPPGVGKTTMAHIVARHIGYHVQEMNASDDRNLDAFKKQLEGAMQMQATLDGDKRPHCLVLDEIDGAPLQSINYLVSLATPTSTESSAGSEQSNAASRDKGKRGGFVLRRPIVAICNDLYAPALRDLRKIALVVKVPPLEESRLTERLCQIARLESIVYEPGCFELMCAKSGFDVRSCINSLQMLVCGSNGSDGGKRLTLAQVAAADIGNKDMQRSLFSTWHTIFQAPKGRKRCFDNQATSISLSTRVKTILRACEECGEQDRLHAGLFENYVLVDYQDQRLESTFSGLDWLGFADLLDRVVRESQTFEMKRYSVYVAVIFHLLFSSRQFTKLVYPQRVLHGSVHYTLMKHTSQ